jgi:hypothetical protein
MAMPPIDMSAELEEGAPEEDELGLDEGLEEAEGVSSDLDPMFAADAAEAFPELDDAGLAALQRAILALISSGGSAPPVPPMGL